LALGLDALRLRLLLECAEIVVEAYLEAEPHALALVAAAALAQHHRMMVERRGQERRVLFPRVQRQPEHVGVIGDLPLEVGRLIGGVGDLLDADDVAGVSREEGHDFFLCMLLTTSTMTATSWVSPRPMSTHF